MKKFGSVISKHVVPDFLDDFGMFPNYKVTGVIRHRIAGTSVQIKVIGECHLIPYLVTWYVIHTHFYLVMRVILGFNSSPDSLYLCTSKIRSGSEKTQRWDLGRSQVRRALLALMKRCDLTAVAFFFDLKLQLFFVTTAVFLALLRNSEEPSGRIWKSPTSTFFCQRGLHVFFR